MARLPLLAVMVTLCLVPQCRGYCFLAGRNPWFSGPPVVEQVTLTSVRVSWQGLLQEGKCADNIIVKHYKGYDSSNWKLSEPLDVSVNTYIVYDVSPNQEYTYQVIAREEKGLLGVDYNKGEKAFFTTSRLNREQGLEVKIDDLLHVRRTSVDTESSGKGIKPSDTVVPVFSESQRTVKKVAGLQVEVLMGIIIGLLVVVVVSVGLLYNCVKKKGPEKDLELNSSMYEDDEEEEGGDAGDEDEEEDDKFEESAKDSKKYDMMVEQNKTVLNNSNKLLRPMSVA